MTLLVNRHVLGVRASSVPAPFLQSLLDLPFRSKNNKYRARMDDKEYLVRRVAGSAAVEWGWKQCVVEH